MQIKVADFQSLGSVDIEVDGLTVLVGPSNRGKSALVRAIEALLFNRPGDGFVRTGKKRAGVGVTGLPGVGSVTWMKGGGKTVYEVNAEPFLKVGQGTPPALTDAGYRDIWVGDKDRKKGEYLRPQVSGQFEAPFLLTRSGAFVSDVLGAISRHAVLLTAQGRAAGDQRTAKQRHGVRGSDLSTAQQQAEALADVPALVARVQALQDASAARDRLAAKAARVRGLLARRDDLRPVLSVPLPAAAQMPDDHGARAATLRRLADQRARLAPLATATMPQAAPAPPVALEAKLAKARGLAGRRGPVAALAAAALPAEVNWPGYLSATAEWSERREQLYGVAARRRYQLDILFRCETAVRAATAEAEQAEVELANLLGSMTICPTCERPV